jgi:flagellar hook-associated protein 1 FlgK
MANAMTIGVSGLRAFQSALSTVSHNIANANTEGYSRQIAGFTTGVPTLETGQWAGSGVKSTGVTRAYESFVASQVTSGNSTTQELDTFVTYSSRLDNLYADPEVGMAPVIQSFFDSLQALSADSGSAAARQLVLSDAQAMADRFGQLNRRTEEIRDQVNDATRVGVAELDSFATSLADVNASIITATAQGGGVTPPDLLDQRDQLINEMAKLTAVNTVEQSDGSVNLFVGNGVSLVIGGQAAQMTTQPSQSDFGRLDIVVKQSQNAEPQVVTPYMTGGEIGGLQRFATEILDSAQDQLGLTAIGIAEQMNAQHRLGVDLNGILGGDFFAPQTGESLADSANTGSAGLSVAFVDSNHLTGDEYKLSYDGTNYRLNRVSDGRLAFSAASIPTGEITLDGRGQGFSLATAGTVDAGDSFLIRPTRNGARDIRLSLADTGAIAAGGPVITDPRGDVTNTGNGLMSQPLLSSASGTPLSSWGGDITLTFSNDADGSGNAGFSVAGGAFSGSPAYVLYDPLTDSGKTLTLGHSTAGQYGTDIGDVTFSMQGTPAVGDTYDIRANAGGAVADNRNATLLAEMQNDKTMLGGNATFEGAYSRMVAMVGTETRQAEIAFTAQDGLLQQAKAAQADVSGVNLDEEAANLLRYQQAYQAAAQVVNIARSTFDTLLAAVRG